MGIYIESRKSNSISLTTESGRMMFPVIILRDYSWGNPHFPDE